MNRNCRRVGWTTVLTLVLFTALGAAYRPSDALPTSRAAHSRPPPARSGSASGLLTVIFTGEQDGYLAPCGCSQPQLGGLPRLGAFLRRTNGAASQVRVQNGDLVDGAARQDQLKAETLIEMLNVLNYDAISVGEADFQLGEPFLDALQARFHGVILCGNVLRADGHPVFKNWTRANRTISGKTTAVTIVGLISSGFDEQVRAANPDLHTVSPSEALQPIAPELARQPSPRILLYHGPANEAADLAAKFPIFQLIICAHEGDHPSVPRHVGGAVIVCSGQDGKYVGSADLAGAPGWNVHDVNFKALGPVYADDPAVGAIKEAYISRVDDEQLLAQVIRTPTETGDRYAGSSTCKTCHAEPYRIWQASGHSHALETLAGVHEDRDPECVECHVVGLDKTSGFTSNRETPDLAGVGCESCHGPALRHVHNPAVPLPKVDVDACLQCHTTQQSPGFDFAVYWPRIRH
jgi:2',3'-cyclic-nucleotide 2'-phosphodiesterase (5'-nucleotidase family)